MGEPAAPLANDFWMATHDRLDGKSALTPAVLGVGLASALLCELLVLNWIDVETDQLRVHPDAEKYAFPDDIALQGVLEMLVREMSVQRGRHYNDQETLLPVSDWIAHLQSGPATQLVEERLSTAGLVRREIQRQLFRGTQEVLVPESVNTSGWPVLRIKMALREGKTLHEQDLSFAGLLMATGMQNQAFKDLGSRELEFLGRQTSATMRPALRALIICAETAVSRMVMTR